MVYIIALLLIALSALFSGLTLGLLSLDVHTLKRQADLGDIEAKRIYPLRKQGNLLLTTLLLGNVAVNTSLSIFLGSVVTGVVAGVTATSLIFLFGEIIPQAVISRHAKWFGARLAFFVTIVMVLFYPITFLIAYFLDRLLGEELPKIYSKSELMQIISEHGDSEQSTIDRDEERIVHGALQFSHKLVSEIYTPLAQVVAYPLHQKLTDTLFEDVREQGYSRYPIYEHSKDNVVGILYAKDLIIEDSEVTIAEAREAFSRDFLIARPSEYLDTVLTRMLKAKQHMCVVIDTNKKCVGVVSLEDIIEEIIQHEIEDENDALV